MRASSRTLCLAAALAATGLALGQSGTSAHAEPIRAWAESWSPFICGEWQWQYAESEHTAAGPVYETVLSCWPGSLSRKLRIIPHDPDVLGVDNVEGFTADGDWYLVDLNSGVYRKGSSHPDLHSESRTNKYASFLGLGPSAVAAMIVDGHASVNAQDVSHSAASDRIVWESEDVPGVRVAFEPDADGAMRLATIERKTARIMVQYHYAYDISRPRLPVSVLRQIAPRLPDISHTPAPSGPDNGPLSSSAELFLIEFRPSESAADLYVSTSDIVRYDDQVGQALDGEGNVLFEYVPPEDPVTARQWATIGVLAGLSGIAIAVGIVIYRRVRS